ncbi:thioredoxin [bacterium SCSIO 12643]|nr:thioredoxin [bacterium SCSIO 12643]
MKSTYISVLLAIPFLYVSCSDTPSQRQKERTTKKSVKVASVSQKGVFKNLSAKEFHDQISSGEGIILDVRTPQETQRGAIQNASFISLNDPKFIQKINVMQKDQPIFIYCASGSRSYRASQIMIQNGFKVVYNLNGGIIAWNSSGFPIVRPSSSSSSEAKQLSIDEFNHIINKDQPVLIDFNTAWCAPCKKMSPIIDQLKKEYGQKATISKIDVDQNTDVAKKMGVRGVPVFVLFRNGKEVWRHSGVITKSDLKKVIDKEIQN